MGYRKTTIKLVAERADVSPVTIYNHFEDKTGILFAVLAEEGQETLRIGERLISDRQPRDAAVIYQLLELYVDHPMEFMNKSCWRQALAASLASAHTNFARDYRLIEAQFLQQVIGLMYSLHQETLLKAKTDPVSIGELIWNNTNQMFTEFIVDEPMSLGELHSKLARQTHTILALSLNAKDVTIGSGEQNKRGE